MSNEHTLIVPVDVRAFCVGDGDRITANRLVGVSLDFSALGNADDPLGAAIISRDNGVVRDMNDGALHPLEKGVHLHWNLPRALTHGRVSASGDDAGDIVFPVVPNRWLVTRITASDNPFRNSRSWVVESDHLAADTPSDPRITIFTGYGDGAPFRYLGRTMPAAGWQEPEPGGSALKALTGRDLTAMQTGDPLFASFYPNCRNIFGMHDDLSDVGGGLDGQALCYLVTGWFSDPANDPLAGGLDADAMAERLCWSLPSGASGSFDRSLYVGSVQGIAWNGTGSYLPADPPDVAIDLAMGGNGAEAMAAMIGGEVDDQSHRELLETLLSAFQLGIVSDLREPHPDRLVEVTDNLRAGDFGHREAGLAWTITTDTGDAPTALHDLPADIAAKLTALNTAQARRDAKVHDVQGLRRQLYLDWYRYGLTKLDLDDHQDSDEADQLADRLDQIDSCITVAGNRLFNVNDAQGGTALKDLAALDQQVTQATDDLTAAITPHGWVLKSLVAPWFWRPNDPVVVMSGAEAEHRLRGNDADAPVLCRPVASLIGTVTVGGRQLSRPAGSNGAAPSVETPVPVAIWDEAALLDADWLAGQTGGSAADIAAGLQDFLSTGQPNGVITAHDGVPPVADAAGWWSGGNPWLPLMMQWNAGYTPGAGYDGKMDKLPAGYITDHFTPDDNGRPVPGDWQPADVSWTFTGQAILTPLAAKRLIDALDGIQDDGELTADIGEARDFLKKTPMLYQGLSGFHDALLMLGQIPQLAPDHGQGEVHGDDGLFHRMNRYVGDALRFASYPDSRFVPVRAGYINVAIKLADVFGQIRDTTQNRFSCAPAMRWGDSETQGLAYLAPCFTQPARLTFSFLSAADDRVDADLLTSPLCGWLLPNHLDNSLVVYDASGVARGALDILSTGTHWMSAPGATYGEDLDAAMSGANPHQTDLVRSLHDNSGTALIDLMRCIGRAAETTTGSLRPDPSLAVLIGSPVALVQTELRLELMGRPAVNQSWDAMDADLTTFEEDDIQGTYVEGRTTNGVEQVNIETVIGTQDRFRDGVIGFFVADESGRYDFSRFYSPLTGNDTPQVQPARVSLAADGRGLRLLMLVDPRARIHVMPGVLPTRSLTIPPDLTLPFLDRLSVTFPVRPVLVDNAGLDLPVPDEPSYSWSWLQHDGGEWQTLPLSPTPSATAERYLPQRIYSGWLKLSHDDTAS